MNNSVHINGKKKILGEVQKKLVIIGNVLLWP